MHNRFLEILEFRADDCLGPHILLSLLGAAGASALWITDLPGRYRWLGAGIVGLRLAVEFHDRCSRHGRHYVERAVLLPDSSWRLDTPAGRALQARLARAWGLSAGPLIALEWCCDDGRRRQCWLLRNRAIDTSFRRLRVRLRLS